jgi:hypothetical protein
MGVDFYTCTQCSDTFADCERYACCNRCGSRYCTSCSFGDDYRRAAQKKSSTKPPKSHVTWDRDGGGGDDNECIACTRDPKRRKIVTDAQLVAWLAQGTSRDEFVRQFVEATLC